MGQSRCDNINCEGLTVQRLLPSLAQDLSRKSRAISPRLNSYLFYTYSVLCYDQIEYYTTSSWIYHTISLFFKLFF